jgi:HEPN domain-containing protein
MNGSEPQQRLQWDDERLWLAKAAEDLDGARMLLSGGLAALAAFHVQQATEKALKGLLVAAAQDVRRVHDIATLADLARAHWPDVVPSPFPLITANQWYITTRHPDIEDESPPSIEIEEALQVLDSLMAAITTLAR